MSLPQPHQSPSPPLPAFDATAQLKFTDPPDPAWTFGQAVEGTPVGRAWLAGEKEGWTVVDAAAEDPGKLYALLISGIVPRPVAFVSTLSEDGVANVAPFSWFNMVTHNPPILSVSISNTARGLKDSAANIKATKQFTVNIISEPWIANANACAIDAPHNFSEWALSGLTPVPSIHVGPPRVKESAFSMECELFQATDIVHPTTGLTTTTLVLGRITHIHVRTDVLTARGTVDAAKLRPVARMGDITYAALGAAYRIPRPVWKAEGERRRREEKLLGAVEQSRAANTN